MGVPCGVKENKGHSRPAWCEQVIPFLEHRLGESLSLAKVVKIGRWELMVGWRYWPWQSRKTASRKRWAVSYHSILLVITGD
jgi:hypothetical protein